mmetsp:Transcript_3695/g.10689  ORF Transcript_3695/g.10689 Transcript_3695/m.10689 type:complete len:537 (+) Transcript_3695:100-1710(+)
MSLSAVNFGSLIGHLRHPGDSVLEADGEVCVDSDEMLQPFFLCEPPEQVRLFILLWCSTIAVQLMLHHSSAARFYSFFVNAKLDMSERRGLSYTGCKAYGIFPVPKLPEVGLQVVFGLLVGALLLACNTSLAPRFFLFASLGLYFLYFGQLWCESKHGGHGSLLMPSVIMLLTLSGGPQSTPATLVFIKVFLGLVYFAGAVSKVVIAALFKQRWAGSTMQAYVFDAMWSRPHRWAVVRKLQRCMLSRWWVCSFLAVTGLAFEFAFLPAILLGGPLMSVLAAGAALGFHFGVDVLQGLDFFPFWCPVFWVFLPDLQAVLSGRELGAEDAWSSILARGFEEEPCRWIMSATYVLIQLVVQLRLQDVRENMESLPFTSCPMFAAPRNIFGDELRGGCITDLELRSGGHVDFAYNFFPWQSDMPLSEKQLRQMPGRVLMFMSTLHCHELVTNRMNRDALGQELLVASNFEVSDALRETLTELVRKLEAGDPSDWADHERMLEVLDLQQRCHTIFREEGPAGGQKSLRSVRPASAAALLKS